MLKFEEAGHKYSSEDGTNWISVTSLVKLVEEHFDADAQAIKVSKNKKSKWYGMTPEEIKSHWKKTNSDSIDLGNWYHNEREKQICGLDTIEREDEICNVVRPIINGDFKYAPEQVLQNNHVYPEHFVYLKSAGVCGQSDLVEVRKGFVNIIDFKTNKSLTTTGYTNWQGITKKLLHPLSHLEDCKLNIYNIQLSLYMYIILKHNPKLKPGKLIIHHIIFKEVDRDSFDNPIYDRDSNNDPIVLEIKKYELPYLKNEVIALLNQLKK